MKALKFFAKKDLRLIDVPEPAPGPGEVKIRVKQAGICGSDVHQYTDGPIGLLKIPNPITGKKVPDITMGHEFAGEVTEVGPGVAEFQPGDRIAVCPSISCGKCRYCRVGRPTLCTSIILLGFNQDGAFAQYVLAPVGSVYKIPDSLTYEQAAFCEPLAVSIHGVRLGKIGPGSTVTVLGAGTIGLLAMQAALAAGAGQVFVIEPVAKRRELALQLGAAAVFDPAQENISKEIARLTGGSKADVTIEASGSQKAMGITPWITAMGGAIVQLGMQETASDFPFFQTWIREQTIIPSAAYDIDFPIAVDLLARGKVRVDPMITSRIGLDAIIDQGYEELLGPNRTSHIKILVSP